MQWVLFFIFPNYGLDNYQIVPKSAKLLNDLKVEKFDNYSYVENNDLFSNCSKYPKKYASIAIKSKKLFDSY